MHRGPRFYLIDERTQARVGDSRNRHQSLKGYDAAVRAFAFKDRRLVYIRRYSLKG